MKKIYYGAVKEKGTHKSLLAENGRYAELYAAQKELEEGYREMYVS